MRHATRIALAAIAGIASATAFAHGQKPHAKDIATAPKPGINADFDIVQTRIGTEG